MYHITWEMKKNLMWKWEYLLAWWPVNVFHMVPYLYISERMIRKDRPVITRRLQDILHQPQEALYCYAVSTELNLGMSRTDLFQTLPVTSGPLRILNGIIWDLRMRGRESKMYQQLRLLQALKLYVFKYFQLVSRGSWLSTESSCFIDSISMVIYL